MVSENTRQRLLLVDSKATPLFFFTGEIMSQWYLNACGITKVQYTYNPDKGRELGFTEFVYHWEQIGGLTGYSHVFVENVGDLNKLVAHWNSQQPDKWRYWT